MLREVYSISDRMAASAGATNTSTFQHQGYEHALIKLLMQGTETTDPPTVITVTQSDDNTTFVAITGLVAGTDFTVPTAIRTASNHTQNMTTLMVGLDLRNIKRYVKVTCNAATLMTQVLDVTLDRGKISPSTATLANVAVLVNA